MKTSAPTPPPRVAAMTEALADPRAGRRLADMRALRPAKFLVTDRHRHGCWKLLPYRCAEGSGWLAAAPVSAAPRPVTLPLNASGPHHVLLGIWSHGKAAFRARLSGAPCFRYLSGNTCLMGVQEFYFDTADLTGRDLEFAAWPGADGSAIGLAWVRLVPAGAQPPAPPATAKVHATSDVMTWVARTQAATPEDLQAAIEILRDAEVDSLSFDCGLFGERYRRRRECADDHVHILEHARQGREFLRDLHAQGLDVLELYHEFTEALGLPQDYYLRLQEFRFDEPRTDSWRTPFFEAHPEWRCVYRDGRRTAQFSYAFPEVRDYLLQGLERMLTPRIGGLTLACHRSGPCVLYEDPVAAAYRAETGRDMTGEDELDPAVLRFRAAYFTKFVRACRRTLDRAAERDGKPRSLRAIVLADQRSNLYYGFDVEDWVRTGLVDTLLVYPVYVDFSWAGGGSPAPRPWEKNYHPDRVRREARYARARINREANCAVIDWAFFESLRKRHGIRFHAGFTRIPANARAFLEELQRIYRHEVDGVLAWDIWNFITTADLRPLGEHMGRREWLLSLMPQTLPATVREIPLHDLGDVPVDLFGAQMSG